MLLLYGAESDLRAALVATPMVVSLAGILATLNRLQKRTSDSVLGITFRALKVASSSAAMNEWSEGLWPSELV
jgi:hypothetical protein